MNQLTSSLGKILPTGGAWENIYLGNSLSAWILAATTFVVLLLLFKIVQSLGIAQLKRLAAKTKTDIDDTLVQIVRSVRPPFYSFVSFYIALRVLAIPHLLQKIVEIVLISWVTWQAIVVVQIVIDFAFKKGMKDEDLGTKSALAMLSNITKATLWVLGGLFILSNLGINITSLVAGLGIGGVAVALAIQNILGDLFSSFAIHFDKPFVVGDFIQVGDYIGEVEKIGIKTTRLKALQGEEVVISNQELTSARVRNFKKLKERRVVFSFGVTYETSTQKIREIPKIIKEIINSVPKTRFGRTHFSRFDDSALSFEVVYYFLSSDYDEYMAANEEILVKIKEAFEERDIDMAYPTRTLYVKK